MAKRLLVREVAFARGKRCRSDRLSGKSLLYEESNGEALVVELPRGMLTADATEGLEGSDEKGNVEVGDRASSTEVNTSH